MAKISKSILTKGDRIDVWIVGLSILYLYGLVTCQISETGPASLKYKDVTQDGMTQPSILDDGINATEKLEIPGITCVPQAIDDFPQGFFTPKQREQGFIVFHFLTSIYMFIALAIVCDDYFVPSVAIICDELKIPSDVAGATFMAIATSAPELFTNLIGTFITKGDVGVGTIVGSAVFNILAVAAVCGIWAGMSIQLQWWSVTRDCVCYSVSVVILIIVLRDEKIYLYEALILVVFYVIYILAMYYNSNLRKGAKRVVKAAKRGKKLKKGEVEQAYTDPRRHSKSYKDDTHDEQRGLKLGSVEETKSLNKDNLESVVEEEEEEYSTKIFTPPFGEGCKTWVEWIVTWPIRLAYYLTIPNCETERWRRWYVVTFIMCVLWIGSLSYVVNWMMTIIGHTLKIPDSVTGLTFIAAGTSVPEVASSLIVARKGLGTMALSNSIGSNTFDILMCLGFPWLIRTAIIANDKAMNFVRINSRGLEYSIMMLMSALIILYTLLAVNKFKLDKKVGFLSLILYSLFLIFASLFELNVFFTVNLPTCVYHED